MKILTNPEDQGREHIARLLSQAGWMFVDADSDSITIANILAFCDKSAIQPIPSNQNTV